MYGGYLDTLQSRFLSELEGISVGYNFDYGPEFEIALCETLGRALPKKYGVARGYAVNRAGKFKGDDILIYSPQNFPTLGIRAEQQFLRKDKVPIEAIYAYIEAKHTIYLINDEKNGQSIFKAMQQVGDVKELVGERPQREWSQISDTVNLGSNLQIDLPEHFPAYRNPPFGVVMARRVKLNAKGDYLTDDEIYDVLLNSDFKAFANRPDLMILGEGIVVIPVESTTDDKPKYSSPFAQPGHSNFAIVRCKKKAFGAGFAIIMGALDTMTLSSLPWRDIFKSSSEMID